VLVARRADRLAELSAVTVTTIAMDLAVPDAGERLSAAVAERGVQVTSLINNAGFATNRPFHEEDPAQQRRPAPSGRKQVGEHSVREQHVTMLGQQRVHTAGRH
jgi:NAD(P)-dependent dehydrogenase (short-subunit alcohol dehydrogenase family)